jgi:osmoprotectant transport system ATP-binding protein
MTGAPPHQGQLQPLRADGVSKRFGDVSALDDVSVAVEAGGCLALVGESGSGKTTLLRSFNRLVAPDRGRILIEGVDAAQLDPVALRRRIGYVPQDGGLLPHWRIQRNTELVLRLTGDAQAADRARAALTLVGLDPDRFGSRWPRELSGGQRQRVAIARALAARPSLMLLDEPFGALDAITRAELQDSFSALRSEIAMTCVLVTHDLHEAMLLATKIAVLRRGRVEQCDAPETLARAPATPYVATLLQRARITSAAFAPAS